MSLFPFKKASDLADVSEKPAWLIEGLWGDEAVGILGGEPKCCKSFLALDLAVATASGGNALGRFQVVRPGRVLLYAAEDSAQIVKRRLLGVCTARDKKLSELEIHVLTPPRIRLDLEDDLQALDATISHVRPQLLILDPFVRLHRIDENSSSDVAKILDSLRHLQRKYHVAILVVHHAKKNGGNARAGQALRGSSEFHAWGDSNLYMRRLGDSIQLSIEHRSASSPQSLPLKLVESGSRLSLEIVTDQAKGTPEIKRTPPETILKLLEEADAAVPFKSLKSLCELRTATLCTTLNQLVDAKKIFKSDGGFSLLRE